MYCLMWPGSQGVSVPALVNIIWGVPGFTLAATVLPSTWQLKECKMGVWEMELGRCLCP